MAELHVSTAGSDEAPGTPSAPLRTIGRAAALAVAGDEVVVHGGEYREWVKPRRGGLSDTRRIVYRAADGEHVVIKGSERVTGWVDEGDGIWRVGVPNGVFGDFNPYAETLEGDWVVRERQDEPRMHLGDVYLNGSSFFEVTSRDGLARRARRTETLDHWTGRTVAVADPDQTMQVWYAEVTATETTIWAAFGDADPNAEIVEINVRRSVFYPDAHGIDYITVRGFELAQAACPWTPPTAAQPGLIGPNWAKGWIIEDNVIHDAKCSAVSLGKEASTGDNYFTHRLDKPGYQYQLESVFAARHIGWSRESVGGHIVRNNTIYDCGQNGIVGHLGCVFSTIHDNHIFRIATKREYFGHEIAGIKLHAAIDVEIRHNRIHDCTLGIWLDWQTQGTRITQNVLYDNCRDFFVEVSHGPYVIDHNVFASPASIESHSQGGAFVANLVGGTLRLESVMNRATPYHLPHSTEVAGYAVIYGADDRFRGNVFVGNSGDPADVSAAYGRPFEASTLIGYGTAGYDGHPASFGEYLDAVRAGLPGDLDVFLELKQPVQVSGNVYLAGAQAYAREADALVDASSAGLAVVEDGDAVYLSITLPEGFEAHRVAVPTTADLGRVRFPDLEFDARDGSPLRLDADLLGAAASGDVVAGPLASLRAGENRVRIWG